LPARFGAFLYLRPDSGTGRSLFPHRYTAFAGATVCLPASASRGRQRASRGALAGKQPVAPCRPRLSGEVSKKVLVEMPEYFYPVNMTLINTTQTNQKWTAQLKAALNDVLEQVLRRGFYGTAGIVVTVQDGTIQAIRRNVEQIER
jgi:hypothetical protein